MTYTHGKHTLKWGADFRRRQLTIYQTNQGNGRFNFSPALTDSRNPAGTGGDSAASFLLGYPTLIAHDYTQNWPGERGYELGVYLADDWRVTSKLTINLGLRWDYFSPFSEVANRWANFNLADRQNRRRRAQRRQSTRGCRALLHELRPALRLRLSGAEHTVVRGGFGLFYNPTGSEGNSLRLFRQLPFGTTTSHLTRRHLPRTACSGRICSVGARESCLCR